MANMITAGKDCQGCDHYEQIDKFKSYCNARNKKYTYGQMVPCDDKLTIDKEAEKKFKEKNDAD